MKAISRILLIVFIIASAGCALTSTQKEATSRFAQASADIGDFSATEFSHFRAATIDMNVTSIALRGKAKLLDANGEPNLDETLKPKAVIERVKSAQALSSYGRLLLSLVNDTQEEELKQASSHFVNSFKSVSKRNLTDAQLEGLGQFVQSIGTLWVEAKKAKAVKAIVPAASADVDNLCDLLINDFSPTALNIAQGFDATISNLVADASIALKDNSVSYTDRLIAIDGMRKAWDEREYLANISSQAVATLKQLKAANVQLKQSLENDNLSIADIQAVGQQANELRAAVTALTSGR